MLTLASRIAAHLLLGFILGGIAGWAGRPPAAAQVIDSPAAPVDEMARRRQLLMAAEDRPQEPEPVAALGFTACVNGFASIYPCQNVDLMAVMPLATFGAGRAADIWGWTDPLDGKEYALIAFNTGVAFVELSDPTNPLYLGSLPTETFATTWRDVEVYNNYAFIVADAAGSHGVQIFDLTELRDVPNPPVTFAETAHYDGVTSSHTLVINEVTGFAYATGTNTCSGGLHIINIQDPLNVAFAGCVSNDGYVHETQCVVYNGPDVEHQGQEICFNANEDTITIVDVTDKGAPAQLSRTGYSGVGYTHQGWLTEDHAYFLLNDETDELTYGHHSRTRIWDMADLDAPALIDYYDGPTTATDHNLYVHEGLVYEANNAAGLRILDASDVSNGNLTELAYFDTYPANDFAGYTGSWGNYPFFNSGLVVISSRFEGFFVLRPTRLNLSGDSTLDTLPGTTVTHTFSLNNSGPADSFSLSVSDYEWPTTLLTPSPLALAPGESVIIVVEVEVPGLILETVHGTDSFTLTAVSESDPTLSRSAVGTTHSVTTSGIVTSGDMSGEGAAGETITYQVVVTNTGNYTDTFSISYGPSTWNVSGPDSVGPLAAGVGTTAEIQVTVGNGKADVVTVTFTSGLDNSVSATVTLSTTSATQLLYLPLVIRP
ncbi:MAG: choice-of-anchor B family protein [Chloroflexota bacterium]